MSNRVRVVLAVFAAVCMAGMAFVQAAPDAATQKVLDSVTAAIKGNAKVQDKTKTFVLEKMLPMCTNEVFIKETEAQNAKGMTIDEIKKIDDAWQKAEEELPIQKEKLSNTCAQACKEFGKANPAIAELFVMDNLGGNVGQMNLTSDYWQGDEAKWQNSYNKGAGGLDAGDLKFDKSCNAETQQLSVPIVAKDGKVIGSFCVGVVVSKL
jgi:hypothetical protein